MAVLRSGRSLGMVLNREHRPAAKADAAIASVEQGYMSFLDSVRQAFALDCEAVVHGGDFHFSGGVIHDRVIGAVMPMGHLDRAAAEREAEQLVAKTDAEKGNAGVDDIANDRQRIFSRSGRVSRPVRQEHAIRLTAENLLRLA